MLGFSTLKNDQSRPIALYAATVANAAGSGEGASVTVTISNIVDKYGSGLLPRTYVVNALASQAATVTVSSKTTSGFTLTLTPISSSVTLAAGSVDVLVFG
jgi:hypothetical protein